MQSPEQHHTVIIHGAPKESGEHSIEVGVPGCKTAEHLPIVNMLTM